MAELREQQTRRKTYLINALDTKMFHEKPRLPYDGRALGFVFTDAEFTRRKISYAPHNSSALTTSDAKMPSIYRWPRKTC